jgi:MFS family permease
VLRDLRTTIRTIGTLVSISILFQMVYAALLAFLTLYLVDVRGVSPALAAVFFGLPQLIGVLGAPLGGLASDRFGRRSVILLGMGLMGPSFLALTLVPSTLLLAPLLGIGLAATFRQTVTEVLVMDSAPPQRRATILGSYYLLAQPLGGLAAPLLGSLAGAFGIAAAVGGVNTLLAFASLAVVLLQRRL